MKAVVAIHDVHPLNHEKIKSLRKTLRGLGVKKLTYCVIPIFHGVEEYRIDKNPSFAGFLRKGGEDIAIHGLTHLKISHLSEEEFFRLPYQSAAGKLKEGLAILKRAGLKPNGMIPPVWVASPGTILAAKDAGLNYAVSGNRIFSFKKKKEIPTNVAIRGNLLTIPSTVLSLMEIAKGDTIQVAFHPNDTHLKEEILEELLSLIESKGYEITDYNSFALSE